MVLWKGKDCNLFWSLLEYVILSISYINIYLLYYIKFLCAINKKAKNIYKKQRNI